MNVDLEFDRLKAWIDNVAVAIDEGVEPDLQLGLSFLSMPDLSYRVIDLLAEIGRDCVGALQLLPEDQSPGSVRRITAEPLSVDGVADLLNRSLGNAFTREESSDDTFRISLAGAQEKTALLFRDGVWHRPTGTTPTTHILKLPLGISPQGIDLSSSVENEWLCSEVVRSYGIDVAQCWVETFGERDWPELVLPLVRQLLALEPIRAPADRRYRRLFGFQGGR